MAKHSFHIELAVGVHDIDDGNEVISVIHQALHARFGSGVAFVATIRKLELSPMNADPAASNPNDSYGKFGPLINTTFNASSVDGLRDMLKTLRETREATTETPDDKAGETEQE